jgi:hypothetical protein
MIWFIQEETTYGPFFSDIDKAEGYLRHDCEMEEAQLARALAGTDPYINVVGVVLDDASVSFDG